MLSRLQMGTAMVHAHCRKQQERATYKLNGHTQKASNLHLGQLQHEQQGDETGYRHARIVLGSQLEQEVQGIFRFI